MTVVNRSMYPVQTSMSLISRMQQQFASLQTQLASGQKAGSLAELGSDRYFDLSIRASISRLEGYSTGITMVNTRLAMFDQATSRLGEIQSSARVAMTPGGYGSSMVNFGTVPSLAKASLDEVLNLMNTDINGRYLFSGATTDKRPVESLDAVLNGANGKAGFAQVAAERLQADVGDGLGRLTLGVAGDTVSLDEAGDQPFGFKLSTLTASSAAVATTPPGATQPRSLEVQFTGVPLAGDSITIGLTLPDGTADGIMLKAVAGTPGVGEFQIGADADATAANFKAALQTALQSHAGTTLTAASNNAAANNFFNGQGQAVLRVGGPDFANATQLVNADPTTTVFWYKGADAGNARASVTARVDDTQTINYGAQANENGTVNLVRGLAVMAIQNFGPADANAQGRFDAVASRNLDRLSTLHDSEPGSIQMMSVELANTRATIKTVSSRHDNYSAQLSGMLGDIESISPEEVAMQMLALQTRLTATYQTTSMIAQLSLVNYLK
jgi:flagellin-like hook-associated protein FlgL